MIARLTNYVRTQLRRSPFTVTGRLLALSAAFCLFAIVDASLSALLSYVLWLLMIAFGCGLLFRPRLQVNPCWVPLVLSGQTFVVRLEVKNISRIGAYDMQCTLELPHEGLKALRRTCEISAIAPGETALIEFSLQATQRGVFELSQLTVGSLFPLSLYRFLSFHPLHHPLVIAPSYESQSGIVGEVVEGLDPNEAAGQTKKNSLLEYIGSREFRPGVPVRRWDFASWARLGTPSVREFSEGSDSLVVVVIDSTHHRYEHEDPLLETVLSTAAGVVVQLSEMGQSILLIVAGKSISLSDRYGTTSHQDDYLIQLAKVKGESSPIAWDRAWDEILVTIPPHATLVAIFSDGRGLDALGRAYVGTRKVIQRRVTSNDHLLARKPNVLPPEPKEGSKSV